VFFSEIRKEFLDIISINVFENIEEYAVRRGLSQIDVS
jgi:hypothetical protein